MCPSIPENIRFWNWVSYYHEYICMITNLTVHYTMSHFFSLGIITHRSCVAKYTLQNVKRLQVKSGKSGPYKLLMSINVQHPSKNTLLFFTNKGWICFELNFVQHLDVTYNITYTTWLWVIQQYASVQI